MDMATLDFLRAHATTYARDEGEYAEWLLSRPDVADQPDIPEWLDHRNEYTEYMIEIEG